jgi:hypothetical protein
MRTRTILTLSAIITSTAVPAVFALPISYDTTVDSLIVRDDIVARGTSDAMIDDLNAGNEGYEYVLIYIAIFN